MISPSQVFRLCPALFYLNAISGFFLLGWMNIDIVEMFKLMCVDWGAGSGFMNTSEKGY